MCSWVLPSKKKAGGGFWVPWRTGSARRGGAGAGECQARGVWIPTLGCIMHTHTDMHCAASGIHGQGGKEAQPVYPKRPGVRGFVARNPGGGTGANNEEPRTYIPNANGAGLTRVRNTAIRQSESRGRGGGPRNSGQRKVRHAVTNFPILNRRAFNTTSVPHSHSNSRRVLV